MFIPAISKDRAARFLESATQQDFRRLKRLLNPIFASPFRKAFCNICSSDSRLFEASKNYKASPYCSHSCVSAECALLSCNVAKIMEAMADSEDVESSLEALGLQHLHADVFGEVLRNIQRKYLKPQLQSDGSRKRKAPVVQRFLSREMNEGKFIRDPVLVEKGVEKAMKLYYWLGKHKDFEYDQNICQEMAWTLAKANRLKLLWRFLHEMAARSPDLVTTKTVTTVMNVLAKEGLVKEALHCFYRMKQFHCKPDLVAYNSAMNALCKAGHFRTARFLFDQLKMPGSRCRPDAYTYAILIGGYSKHSLYTKSRKAISKRLYEANKLFREMQYDGFARDAVIYNCLIDALCKRCRIDRALELLEQMKKEGCSPNQVTYNSFIRYYCIRDKPYMALQMLSDMKGNNVSPDSSSYTPLILIFCKARKLEDACRLLTEMVEAGFIPSSHTYETVQRCLRDSDIVVLPGELCRKIECGIQARVQDAARSRKMLGARLVNLTQNCNN